MILMFEPNKKMKLFDDLGYESPSTFLIADHQFNVGELASNFDNLTGISPKTVLKLKQEKDRSLNCDDIVKMINFDCGINDLKSERISEVEIVFQNLHRNHREQFYNLTSSDKATPGNNHQDIKIEIDDADDN